MAAPNALAVLKNKLQAQREELDRSKDQLELKCKEVDEEKAKRSSIELEISTVSRRIKLLEHESTHAQSRLQTALAKLEALTEAAAESERSRKTFERSLSVTDDRSYNLDKSVKEARDTANEAERKLCEASRKLIMVETELEKAEERADTAEAKVKCLDEDLEKLTSHLKSLQFSEGQTSEREDNHEKATRDLATRLKDADNRVFESERSSAKLQREVDRLEEDIKQAKQHQETIRAEMDSYFEEVKAF